MLCLLWHTILAIIDNNTQIACNIRYCDDDDIITQANNNGIVTENVVICNDNNSRCITLTDSYDVTLTRRAERITRAVDDDVDVDDDGVIGINIRCGGVMRRDDTLLLPLDTYCCHQSKAMPQ